MKKFFLLAAAACLALFVSCEKQGVPHTGDETGTLYGIWTLKTKTEITKSSSGDVTKDVDYTNCHFYLALSDFPIPHAIGKKGSFTDLDLSDVDVDGVRFTYNADQKKISFNKAIWLSDEALKYNMILSGTFDVAELNENVLVLRQEDTFAQKTTIYSYERVKK